MLIRLTNKYPGGFPNRWRKIAEILNRSVADVTTKAATIASNLSSRMLVNREFFCGTDIPGAHHFDKI